MNSVNLIGRLTRDPEVRYAAGSQLAVARFSIAINRGKDRDGNDRGADFPNIVVFGKQAENCERFLSKGRLVAIKGKIQTGSYEKDGRKVYTTDIVADSYGGVEFLDWGDRSNSRPQEGAQASVSANTNTASNVSAPSDVPEGLELIEDEDIPF